MWRVCFNWFINHWSLSTMKVLSNWSTFFLSMTIYMIALTFLLWWYCQDGSKGESRSVSQLLWMEGTHTAIFAAWRYLLGDNHFDQYQTARIDFANSHCHLCCPDLLRGLFQLVLNYKKEFLPTISTAGVNWYRLLSSNIWWVIKFKFLAWLNLICCIGK